MKLQAAAQSEVASGNYLPYLRITLFLMLGYWALYVLVAPITVWDAQTYNLARLLLAEEGTLFGDGERNDDRQVAFPWSFDAVHYPFVKLGFAYALPSFACFAALLLILYRLARAASLSRETAYWLCLPLFGMPTLMFQASSTKNDLAVLFGVACWFYALQFWRTRQQAGYLALMAIALAFTAGAKSSGVLLAVMLTIFTLWELRRAPRSAGVFLVMLIPSVFLLGSTEIYRNNARVYGSYFGPADLINDNRNRDGISGTVANLVRYIFGNLTIAGPFGARHLAQFCQRLLPMLGLSNVGYRAGLTDDRLAFYKVGEESESDYGAFGTAALLLCFYFLIRRRARDPVWKLAAAGVGALLITCATVAWMQWNNRFLILPFTAFALAFTLWSLRFTERRRWLRAAFFCFTVLPVVLCPFTSFNRRPADIRDSLLHRDYEETRVRPGMLEIVADLRVRVASGEMPPLIVCAGGDAWVLEVLKLPGLNAHAVYSLEATRFDAFLHRSGSQRLLILLLNRPATSEVETKATLLKRYAEPNCELLEWRRDHAQEP